jgi:uncharacterized protein with beta-barrel porin domain
MNHSLKSKLAVTTALVAAFCGYGRRAYAACSPTGSATYLCSGYNVSTQTISANEAAVSTASGFGVNTASGDAITITGDGALSFTDTNASTITTTAAGGHSLYIHALADDGGTPGSITINSNSNVTGTGLYGDGIRAYNHGTGALTITANGDVTGTDGTGIFANNSGTNLTITTGASSTITGGNNIGIFAYNHGTGALSITANGNVTSTGLSSPDTYGIVAINTSTDLTITTGAGSSITGGTTGIQAKNYGSGATTLNINGAVTGTSSYGIFAYNKSTATNLSITTGMESTVTGSNYGIKAINDGTGATTITANGAVTGTTGKGIYAYNSATATNLSITTGTASTITGDNTGIYAKNKSTGYLSITANGDATAEGWGIKARNYGTNLSITTGTGSNITSTEYVGISATNSGIGALTITANGDVTGSGGKGIIAKNYGTSLAITTGTGSVITGHQDGIDAYNNGTGPTTLTINGDVTSTTRIGILATGPNLSITTGAGSDITSSSTGIEASGSTGATTLTINGDVTSTGSAGIFALNHGTSLSITTGASSVIMGSNYGIDAKNYAGAMTITTNGAVTGTSSYGIFAYNKNTATNLSITSETGSVITGGTYGIKAKNNGTGYLSVTANGTVTGTTKDGIYAYNHNAASTNVTITTGTGSNITGHTNGIEAYGNGTGAVTVTANGNVTGTTGNGIVAVNEFNGTNLVVTVGTGSTITGGGSGSAVGGIQAANIGSGTTTITVDGDVIGTQANGIYNFNDFATSDTITTGTGANITGFTYGIKVENFSNGTLIITNAADATIEGATGILIAGNGNAASGITNAGTIDGTGGTAISLNSLTEPFSITIDGGHIIGNVTDNAPTNGFSLVTVADNFTSQGNFTVSGFAVSDGATFTFGTGNTISSHTAVSDSGTIDVDAAGSSITGGLTVNTGGILNANANFGVSGAFTNNGTTNIATGQTLTVGTMAAGTGTLDFGLTSSSNHAQLTVTGGGANLTGQTIDINVAGVNSLSNGEQILLVHGAAPITGGPGATPEVVTDNSALWSFKVVDGTAVNTPTSADDLFVLVTMAASPFAPTSNNLSLSQTLLGLEGTSNPQLSQIITNLNSAPTTQAANNILQSLEPPLDGGAFAATQSFSDHSLNLTNQRLASLRDGDAMGLSTGDVPYLDGVKAWVQFFGQTATQDERDGIAGYTVHGLGSTFGMDSKNLLSNGIVGAAFSYGHDEVLASDANSTHAGIDSYQFALYSDYDLGQGYYVNGLAGYTFSSNNTLRQNVGEVPGLSATGSFDANEFAATVEGGRAIKLGNATLTPLAMTDWAYYKQQSYTETGAGGSDLSVDSQAISYLDVGIGGKASWDFAGMSDGSHIVPELHTSYRHDLIGDSVEATANFVGGGQQFTAEGASPEQNKFNVGAQVKYYDSGNVELTANYDLDAKVGYVSQTAYLRAAYKF